MKYATGEYIHPIAMDERLADSSVIQRIVDFMHTTPAQWIGLPCVTEPEGTLHIPSWTPGSFDNTIGGSGSVVIRDTLSHIKFSEDFVWRLDIDWYIRLYEAGGMPDFFPPPVAYIVRLHPLQLTNNISHEAKTKEDIISHAKYHRRDSMLRQICNEMKIDTDISSHLDTLWIKTIEVSPKKIVELGIRGGESSRIFGYAALETGASLIGVDIVPCSYPTGLFIQSDDVAYADTYKSTYGADIDVLFIDTSHYYDHTVQEINAWFPLLSDKAVVIFHDTNMMVTHTRKNGTTGGGWNNQRGVIRAIEEYFNSSFDETKPFSTTVLRGNEKWKITHESYCSGLTICHRIRKA
jgi:predicted O-methyltransferase YrrM